MASRRLSHSPRLVSTPQNRRSARRLLSAALSALGLLSLLAGLLILPAASWADAGRWIGSPSYVQLTQELAALQGPDGQAAPGLDTKGRARLADLTALEQAIAASDDRSQVSNDATHPLGLFTLSKKALPGTAPEFGVLAPGHATDDDFPVVGLYVPAGVGLEWVDGAAAATPQPRVIRLPDGELLSVSEPALADVAAGGSVSPAADSDAITYHLSLPPFALEKALPDLAALPRLSQAELDAHPETAPLD